MKVRQALIIAAGRGSRFGDATGSRPKPLIEAQGEPLISRVISSARQAGIDRFTVITGYRAEVLEKYLTEEIPREFRTGLRIDLLHNPDWHLPNGHSVYRARGAVKGPFVLLMADHLFDPSILDVLTAFPLAPDRCRLAVDFHPESVPDLADATKVLVNGGLIADIGKEIPDFNGVDTGVFLCSEAIFSALEEAFSTGGASLSDGIMKLSRSGRMEAADIGGRFWRDIDDRNALKGAEEKLRLSGNSPDVRQNKSLPASKSGRRS